MKLLLIGSIGKAQGLRGGVNVTPFNPDSPLWSAGVELIAVPRDSVVGQPDVVEGPADDRLLLTSVRPGGKARLACAFAGVGDRDAADALGGYYLAVALDSVPPPDDPDEILYHEVRGWLLVDTEGRELGTVVTIVETYTELLEVRPMRGGPSFYVPIVAAIVKAFDRAGRKVVIDPPEGLLP